MIDLNELRLMLFCYFYLFFIFVFVLATILFPFSDLKNPINKSLGMSLLLLLLLTNQGFVFSPQGPKLAQQ